MKFSKLLRRHRLAFPAIAMFAYLCRVAMRVRHEYFEFALVTVGFFMVVYFYLLDREPEAPKTPPKRRRHRR